MSGFFGKIFGARDAAAPDGRGTGGVPDVRVAACALFLEMAEVDGEFSPSERERIVEILREEYGLSDEDAGVITRMARKQLEESIDLWKFTRRINEHYGRQEKVQIIELIWRIVYADGHLSDHEHYLMGKLRKMLRVSQRELIDAKLRVLHGDAS